MVRAFIFCLFFSISVNGSAQEFHSQSGNINISGDFGQNINLGGGGISCADINQDGYDDLTFASEVSDSVHFFINHKNKFVKTTFPGIDHDGESNQVLWIDYDNDGDKDFFVSSFLAPNRLYENDGNFNFTDVTEDIGLPIIDNETHSANFGDFDKDGDLDLYIANLSTRYQNEFYEYDHVNNQYIDKTVSSGLANGLRPSYATVFFDFNDDGLLDIYVSNDKSPENTLYMNVGGLQFIDVSVPSATNIVVDAMNAGLGDPNLDGDFDIYVTNIGNAAYLENQGNNTFIDVATSNGTALNRYTWGANFFDFNNDRHEDLYVCAVNSNFISNPNQINAFLVNNQDGTFSEPFYNTNGLAGMDTLESFTNAMLDYNNDGKMDIALSRQEDPFELYSNHHHTTNNFIKLDLKGIDANNFGIGCLVKTTIAGVTSHHIKHCSIGYQSQHSDYLHIGLGNASSIDQIEIYWPSSTAWETIAGSSLLINGMNVVEEGNGVIDQFDLNICKDEHQVVVNPIPSQIYGAQLNLNCATLVKNYSNVHFHAGQSIVLESGFEVEQGAEFQAEISGCN